jgi:hypothetical protein
LSNTRFKKSFSPDIDGFSGHYESRRFSNFSRDFFFGIEETQSQTAFYRGQSTGWLYRAEPCAFASAVKERHKPK